MTTNNANRRRFQRILFDAPCELHQDDRLWYSQVVDISLKGVLMRRPDHWQDSEASGPFEVIISLADQASAIVMALKLRHAGPHLLGFACQYVDIESAGHLKRLVELNLGDSDLLNRELQVLGDGEEN